MARHQIKQIDLKSWEYKGIHHSKSAYWGRFLKTLLKFRDPLTGGLPWRMFSVDLFSNGSPVFPVSPSKSNSFPRNPAKSQRIHTTFDFPMVQWFPGFPFEIYIKIQFQPFSSKSCQDSKHMQQKKCLSSGSSHWILNRRIIIHIQIMIIYNILYWDNYQYIDTAVSRCYICLLQSIIQNPYFTLLWDIYTYIYICLYKSWGSDPKKLLIQRILW